ncbi:hypothetical protein F5Y10DRAFT_260763 [Nemania abortiva]|nr:hypothetical protein F5Y10DRAFT_260763 [Nemania abortiva]
MDYSEPNLKGFLAYKGDDGSDDSDNDSDGDGGGDSSLRELERERNMLRILQWAKHIVTGVNISDDPLTERFRWILPHGMRKNSWLYTEFIENGTVGTFIRRAREKQIRLPNRLLWRFFQCLIRMVIALGWPPGKPDGEDPRPVIEQINGPAYGALEHADLFLDASVGNLMIGALSPEDPESEHALTPILCLIDLADVRKRGNTAEANRNAICTNLYEIVGCAMILFITLDHMAAVAVHHRDGQPKQFRDPGGSVYHTYAGVLIDEKNRNDPFPWLDDILRILVCQCLAAENDRRPEPQELLRITNDCLKLRDERYFASLPGYDGSESDEHIRLVLSALIFDA